MNILGSMDDKQKGPRQSLRSPVTLHRLYSELSACYTSLDILAQFTLLSCSVPETRRWAGCRAHGLGLRDRVVLTQGCGCATKEDLKTESGGDGRVMVYDEYLNEEASHPRRPNAS